MASKIGYIRIRMKQNKAQSAEFQMPQGVAFVAKRCSLYHEINASLLT